MHRRRFLLSLPVLGAALSGLACTPPKSPFRVGSNIWLGYEPLYLAQDMGLYDPARIRLVAMSNATEVQRALRAGTLEAAALTLDEVLSLKQDGFDLRVVLVMDFSQGADVLLARPGITHLADLRGRRVGVESSAVGAVMLDGALEKAGLDIADIQLVHLTIDQHERAYREDRVDALVTFEPVGTTLLAAGARSLFDSRDIPGRIVDVLAVPPETLTSHPDELRQLIRGHFAALDYLRREPLQAAGRMRPRQGLPAETILTAYRGLNLPDRAENRRLLASPSPALQPAAERLARLMLDRRILNHPVSVAGMFDPTWLPER